MRPNDVEGRDYYFLTNEEFEEKIRNNEFLEYAKYNGYYYGTPKEHVEKCLANGTDVFLVVEVGAVTVHQSLVVAETHVALKYLAVWQPVLVKCQGV